MKLPELPKKWIWVKLGEIIEPSDEKIDPTKTHKAPYIGLEHIEKDTGKLLGYGNSYEVRSTKTKFYKGDLFYGKLRPYLNKVLVADFDGVCSTDILVFPKNSYISNKYLSFRFLCGDFVRFANQNVSGVQHPRVNFAILSQFVIPLPPLPEQHRIIAKVEELFTKLDAGVKSLQTTKKLLKRYRQSVLKAAVEGKLTEGWRKSHRGKLEPASVLLSRIEEDQAKGADRKCDELPPIDETTIPELPKDWIWTRVGKISQRIHYGYTESASNDPIGPKFLRITDIQDNKVSWNSVPYCKIGDDEKQKYLLKSGDLVFARTGATVGKSYLLKGEVPEAVFASYLIRVVFHQKIEGEFVYNFFQSPAYWGQIHKEKIGIGQPNVNGQILSRIVIPLPPLLEQYQIVQEVERRLSISDEVEAVIDAELKRAERLRQSILKQAFSGKLVPQYPSDEPASVLLERIKEEKARREAEGKAKRKSRITSSKRRAIKKGDVVQMELI